MGRPERIGHPAATRAADLARRASRLSMVHGGRDAREVLRIALREEFAGRIALVSSFGAESAVLLALVAEIDPATPVIFVDTGKLFGETRRYRDRLVARLGLRDVRSVGPNDTAVRHEDPHGILWSQDTDACCELRKVRPLARALVGFDAWITGRKRFQSSVRADMPLFETDGRHIKVNPLADWTAEDVAAFMAEHDLPKHPLVDDGYLSIGCMPCTTRVGEGEDARAGRWRGSDKIECGIHLSPLPRIDRRQDEVETTEAPMTIYRDGAFVADDWMRVDDETALPESGALLVSAERWDRDREVLRGRNGPVSVEVDGGTPLDLLLGDLDGLDMIAVRFPKFSDGRGYSTARLLKERYAFAGELRATGDVLLDQVAFLERVGFDSLEVTHEPTRAALARGHRPDVRVHYQPVGREEERLERARVWLRRAA